MSKTFFADLSTDDLTAIYNQNNDLQRLVFDEYADMIFDILDGEIQHVYRDAANIETDAYNNIFVTVKQRQYSAFLDAIQRSDFKYEICEKPELMTIYNRLTAKADLFADYLNGYDNISDDDGARLEAWFDKGIKTLADALKKTYQDYINTMYDDENTRQYFLDNFCDRNYYIRDGYLGTVYQTIEKVFS